MGYVYKILCNETGESYIGSANNNKCLISRKSEHRNMKNKYCSSKQIIYRGNYEFIIIEENIFIDIELRKREQYWIDTSDHTINKIRAYSTPEQKKKYKSEWFQSNKERLRDRHSERITCECGANIMRTNKLRHLKSDKHLSYLNITS
tara:strand:+ start:238 stop:681 length:444 start_codon:yes stop_codon:yes gene_type:complete